MIQWFASAIHPQSPLFWLLVSGLITLTLAVIYWRNRSLWVTWLWIGQWVLVPYLGLITGGLSPRLMGLASIDWPATLGLGSGLLFVTIVLLIVVRVAVDFSEPTPRDSSRHTASDPTASESDVVSKTTVFRSILVVIILSGLEEFHWVFLRGAVWEALLIAPGQVELPAYWAIWIAAIFVVLETALLRPPFDQWLVQLAALVTTSILFLYTRNFWLCWILHGTTVLILTANNRVQLSLPGRPTDVRR